MSRFHEEAFLAFRDELHKEALASELSRSLSYLARPGVRKAVGGGVGSGAGIGAAIGATGGALSGAKDAYTEARESGAGRGQSALHAAGGALRGAAGGGAKGLAAGALVGGAAGLARPAQTLGASKALGALDSPFGSAARFGQRQVHGLTGWTPGGSKSVDALRLGANEDVKAMGLTSVPGIAKALKEHGPAKVLKTSLKGQFDASPSSVALNLGVPALALAGSAMAPEKENGPGRGERAGRALGALGGMALVPSGIPMAAAAATGMAAERAGAFGGKVIDRIRGRREVPQEPARPPASEPGDAGTIAAERIHGPGITGQRSEV